MANVEIQQLGWKYIQTYKVVAAAALRVVEESAVVLGARLHSQSARLLNICKCWTQTTP